MEDSDGEGSASCSSAAEDEFDERKVNDILCPVFDVAAGLMPVLVEESNESLCSSEASVVNLDTNVPTISESRCGFTRDNIVPPPQVETPKIVMFKEPKLVVEIGGEPEISNIHYRNKSSHNVFNSSNEEVKEEIVKIKAEKEINVKTLKSSQSNRPRIQPIVSPRRQD